MNAPVRFPTVAPAVNSLTLSVINAIVACEHADSFNGRTGVDRADIDAWNEAYDAKQAMLTQFRAIGLDEAWLRKLSSVL